MTLNSGPIPLYHQVAEDLRGQLTQKRLNPGDALPTEEQLCQTYGVSRITVRRALDDLIVQGLVHRRRGVGTFVSESNPVSRSVSLVGSLFDALAYPRKLVIEPLKAAERVPSLWIAEALNAQAGEKVVEWDSVSRVDGKPFAVTTFSFPTAIGRSLDFRKDLRSDTPVATMVERHLGEAIVRAEQTVEPESTDAHLSKLLELPQRTAILRVLRTYFTASGRAVECVTVHYHPGQYRLRIALLPSSGANKCK